MRETMRYGFILAVICMLAAGLLAGVNALAKEKIISQALAEEKASLKEVFPQAAAFEPIESDGEVIYYRALDAQKQLIGAAFKASGKGYSSTIETMAGMLKNGQITAIKVLAQNETPGLGARITEPEFTGQFINKKDLSQVQAITGATISSKAAIDSVNQKKAQVLRLMQE
ncbi:MAG: FMN-binding protein [Candidatus Omnitrophica bacterium]|nr:FMN-binding protein [Candidatus Omnitrophota bacterium]